MNALCLFIDIKYFSTLQIISNRTQDESEYFNGENRFRNFLNTEFFKTGSRIVVYITFQLFISCFLHLLFFHNA